MNVQIHPKLFVLPNGWALRQTTGGQVNPAALRVVCVPLFSKRDCLPCFVAGSAWLAGTMKLLAIFSAVIQTVSFR